MKELTTDASTRVPTPTRVKHDQFGGLRIYVR